MALTYEPIATATVSGSSTSEIQFASISGSYTDLVLIANVGSTTNGVYFGCRINSDTGSNYSVTELYGNGSSASSSRGSNRTIADIAYNVTVNTTVNSNYIAHFQSYSNTTTYKSILSRSNNAGNGVSANVILWRNTAAITNIKCYVHQLGGGNQYNFTDGSTVTLYGIKAA